MIDADGRFILALDIAATYDVDVPDQPQYRYGLQKTLLEKFSSRPDLYDQAEVAPFSPPASASLGEPDSIDLLLTFRNTHGWVGDELAQAIFAEFARVLKPGGILGVVQFVTHPAMGITKSK